MGRALQGVLAAVLAGGTAFATTFAEDEAGGAAIFLAGGIAAAFALRRPYAAFVPLAAVPCAAALDLAGAEATGGFGFETVTVLWLLLATPGAVVAGLAGAGLAAPK